MRSAVAALSVAIAWAAFPIAASANTVTLGADLTKPSSPFFDCAGPNHPCTWFQDVPAAGETTATPVDGTLISWAIGSGGAGDRFALRIVRPEGGGLYTGAGTSSVQTEPPSPGNLQGPYPVSIPVKAGDFIGIQSQAGNGHLVPGINGQNCLTMPPPFVSFFQTPDLQDGAAGRMPTSKDGICSELAVSATVRYCLVPRLIGLKLGAAEGALSGQSCTLGQIHRARKRRRRGKFVRAQTIAAGSSVSDTAPIDLTLGRRHKK